MENTGWMPIDKFVGEVKASDYDALIIPGGAHNPDHLRMDPSVLQFVKDMHGAGKAVASICHGPWVLVSAGVLNGKKATSYWSMQALPSPPPTDQNMRCVVSFYTHASVVTEFLFSLARRWT